MSNGFSKGVLCFLETKQNCGDNYTDSPESPWEPLYKEVDSASQTQLKEPLKFDSSMVISRVPRKENRRDQGETEAVVCRCSSKFRKFHRKALVLESIFNKVAGLQDTLLYRSTPPKYLLLEKKTETRAYQKL